MLWLCPVIQSLWRKIENWITNVCDHKIHLHPVYIIFNLETNKTESTPDIIWLILLIIKKYIYSCKCLETKPEFTEVVIKVEGVEKIEFDIALKHNKIHLHYDKWSRFAPARDLTETKDREHDSDFI